MTIKYKSAFSKIESKLKEIDNLKPVIVKEEVGYPQITVGEGAFPSFPISDVKERYMKALDEVASSLSLRLDESISANVWSWNVGTRDIVDSGALKASKKVYVIGEKIEIIYDVPYAKFVHYGGYMYPYGNKNAQKVYIPGRPWIGSLLTGDGPIPRFEFEQHFKDALS